MKLNYRNLTHSVFIILSEITEAGFVSDNMSIHQVPNTRSKTEWWFGEWTLNERCSNLFSTPEQSFFPVFPSKFE